MFAEGHQNKAGSNKPSKCLICKEPQHTYKDKNGQDKPNKAIYACPRWNQADFLMKKKIIGEIQEVASLCKMCSLIGHFSGNCWFKDRYICENSHCGKEHIKDICDFQPFIVSCLQQAVLPPVVPCIRKVSLYQTKDPSVLNSKQKHGSKTSSKNTSRKAIISANHTKAMVPGSKSNDEISTLDTSIENHHRVSETDLCMTFSEPAASKHSA